jgi:hypothetical protein
MGSPHLRRIEGSSFQQNTARHQRSNVTFLSWSGARKQALTVLHTVASPMLYMPDQHRVIVEDVVEAQAKPGGHAVQLTDPANAKRPRGHGSSKESGVGHM